MAPRQTTDILSEKIIAECRRRDLEHIRASETDLSNHCTMGIGPKTRLLFTPETLEEIQELRNVARTFEVEWVPIGGGANTLFTNRAQSKILISTAAFCDVSMTIEDDHVRIVAETGVKLPSLVKKAVSQGAQKMGCLAGIPGTVGGAVVGNAGTKYGEIGSFVEEVVVLHEDRADERFIPDPSFSYRNSDLCSHFVLRVVLSHRRETEKEAFDADETDADDGLYSRSLDERINNQPVSERSAGCMFQNPDDDSAGRLIDEAGLKGTSVGGMRISETHANFFINEGDASPKEAIELLSLVEETIEQKYGVTLEREIRVI